MLEAETEAKMATQQREVRAPFHSDGGAAAIMVNHGLSPVRARHSQISRLTHSLSQQKHVRTDRERELAAELTEVTVRG